MRRGGGGAAALGGWAVRARAVGGGAGRVNHALAAWLQRHETPEETDRRHAAATGLTRRVEPDGMGVTTLRLPPLAHAALGAAIDAQVLVGKASAGASADASGRWPSIAQQRADALLDLLLDGGGAAVGTEVVVHVRGDGCTMDGGTSGADETPTALSGA